MYVGRVGRLASPPGPSPCSNPILPKASKAASTSASSASCQREGDSVRGGFRLGICSGGATVEGGVLDVVGRGSEVIPDRGLSAELIGADGGSSGGEYGG